MQTPEYDIGDSITLSCRFLTKQTRGSIEKNSALLTVQEPSGFANGETVLIVGAGPVDWYHITTISSIAGGVLTLAAPAVEAVAGALVGRLTNPTTVALRVKQPDGTTATPATSNPSVGLIQGTFDPAQKGEHWYGFEGTGAAKGAQQRRFLVVEKRF